MSFVGTKIFSATNGLSEKTSFHATSSLPDPKKSKSVKGTVKQERICIFEVNDNSWTHGLIYERLSVF